ncbi:hypothetical protein EPO05_06485 [Patescibacteria group bacterium]|nr:MAG: hypothetical protein EPO05_06485 [Patescibacteria group bacterium]
MTNELTGQEVSDDKLRSIAHLANAQLAYEGMVAKLEKQLEDVNARLREVRETLLPDAMLEVGMSSFTLADGTKIQVDKFYQAKIPDDKQSFAFAWLRQTGNDSLIKREVKCLFGKGEDAEAARAIQVLSTMGFNPADKSSVHPQTLKSFVRERIENGEELPTELFGVYVGNRAKLTPAKG